MNAPTQTAELQPVLDALSETRERCVRRGAEIDDLGHELRTPLNGIVATVDLLRGTDLNSAQADLITVLAESAERLLRTVDGLADAAALNNGFSTLIADAESVIGRLGPDNIASLANGTASASAASPAHAAAPASPPAPAAPAQPAAPDESQADTLRVLVAEDNTTNQLVVRSLLERMGHHCHVVENGRLAVDAVQQDSFDVILMDCMMPVLDGFGATREIRELDATCADIPILALTANAMKGDRERCLDAGMTEYMAKPVRLDVLTDMLGRFATKRST